MIRANGGWNDFKTMVIKEFPCNNKTELLIEEERHRKEYQATLNKIRAYRTEDEFKQQVKQYYETNKEDKKQYQKQYYETNKEDKKQYQKEYRKVNTEHMKQYNKDWYQANKLKKLIIQKEEPIILTGSPTETETEDEEADDPQIIEVLGNGVKVEIQIY